MTEKTKGALPARGLFKRLRASLSRQPSPGDRFVRLSRFALVGMTGLAVNEAALWIATAGFGFYYLLSSILATQVSTTWNFVLTEKWVFHSNRQGRWARFTWFAIMNNAWLIARVPLLYALTDWFGIHYLVSNLIVLAAATLLRFFIADTWIWGVELSEERVQAGRPRPPHLYDIHGIVSISSGARLPELEPFRVATLHGDPGIDITIANKGFGGIRLRARAELDVGDDDVSVKYVEHLGALGFAMRAEIGDRINIQASRILKLSPHVLYTNVVEPLLRWYLVEKGYALVHGACLDIDGRGVLITARTDTGKTSTCLRAIRAHGSSFVSDDMVIVDPSGTALSYPKPLTVSAHTLKAASAAPLPLWRKGCLQIQSRLHSKSGREVGKGLTRFNLPIATMNAVVQMLVPPPKFFITQLIPEAKTTMSVKLKHMMVIDVGSDTTESIGLQDAAEVLARNTDDAYGFPPYPAIGHLLSNGHRSKEALIQKSFLEGIASTHVSRAARNWFEHLPLLVHDIAAVGEATSLEEVALLQHGEEVGQVREEQDAALIHEEGSDETRVLEIREVALLHDGEEIARIERHKRVALVQESPDGAHLDHVEELTFVQAGEEVADLRLVREVSLVPEDEETVADRSNGDDTALAQAPAESSEDEGLTEAMARELMLSEKDTLSSTVSLVTEDLAVHTGPAQEELDLGSEASGP